MLQLLAQLLVADLRVLRVQPPQPPPVGSHVGVDGDDVWAGPAEEGGVREDEAEVRGEVAEEGAGLEAEDGGGDAAAVEGEDAGFVDLGGGHRCRVRHDREGNVVCSSAGSGLVAGAERDVG